MPDDSQPLLLIVAHADDEVIGAGNLLARLPDEERRRAAIAYVTDSAPKDPRFAREAGFETRAEYAETRRRERTAALSIAGIQSEQCHEFGYTDQESCFHLVEITGRISELIERLRPSLILTHPYEGGHPDHDSAAFATRCALNEMDPHKRPRAMEFTSYHACGEALETGRFLPFEGIPEEIVTLSEAEQQRKKAMFSCYPSQARVLEWFAVTEERFRPTPHYDFTRPPHDGTLHYERLSWGISGEIWREQARQALELLQGSTVWD